MTSLTTTMVSPGVGILCLLLRGLIMHNCFQLGECGVVIENRSNETAITIAVYDRGQDEVLEIGHLDAGSVIDWDDKAVPTNYSSPYKSAQPVPTEHLFVIKNSQTNATVTSQFFNDGTNVKVLNNPFGGLSIKSTY